MTVRLNNAAGRDGNFGQTRRSAVSSQQPEVLLIVL